MITDCSDASSVAYLCDAIKNTECAKEFCHLRNGVCYHTKHLKFSVTDVFRTGTDKQTKE